MLDDLKELIADHDQVLRGIDFDLAALRGSSGLEPTGAARRLQVTYGSGSDLVLRWLDAPGVRGPVLVAYLSGMVDTGRVETGIVAPLLKTQRPPAEWALWVLTGASVHAEQDWEKIFRGLLQGSALIFAEGLFKVWVADVSKPPARSIGRPQTERQVRGPQEAFSSLLEVQVAQIRTQVPDPDLRFESFTLGARQHKKVALVYMRDLANPALVAACRQRIQNVSVDTLPTATFLAGLIRDHPYSVFPTIRSTERVDLAVERLFEGKVVVMVDKDPFVLIAPAPLADFYRTSMDYASSWADSSFVRLIRFAGWAMGIYLPALYVAASVVNPNLVPFAFQVLMIGSETGMPFPPVVEAFVLIFVIEVLREATLRLPKALSQSISTVGAIVVGTAVVRAGLVSPQMIVIITLTALSFFTVPVYELTGSWRLVNFVMLAMAALFGFWGIVIVSFVLIGVLCDMQSFGVPYFTPWAPFRLPDWGDLIVRLPSKMLAWRLVASRPLALRRMAPQPPLPVPHLHPTKDGES